MSSGAAAGIGIGCAVAGALIAAAVAMLVYRKKAAYRPHMDEGKKEVGQGAGYPAGAGSRKGD